MSEAKHATNHLLMTGTDHCLRLVCANKAKYKLANNCGSVVNRILVSKVKTKTFT